MLGHVPETDLPRWYNACDVFVMPNRDIGGDTEGFGMVYIEAAACGKPAVAGRTGGTGSAVLDAVTGLRVDGERVDAIADAIGRLLQDASLRTRLGAAGLERVRAELAWGRVAEKTSALNISKAN
ncbi:glycosyltransferase family 4 protein, partial [Acidithiobacillus sp.]|uniref:glycosyltransferase family 4 protein n=1 Tax=Acidithiobacillus sp. TaxID=1872118 RepID=UPI0031FEB91C